MGITQGKTGGQAPSRQNLASVKPRTVSGDAPR
jgi:hypothetical protein